MTSDSRPEQPQSVGRSPAGTLTLAAGLLGPLDYLGRSVIQALSDADLLIFESDRGARRILKEAGLHRDYLILSEHGETDTLDQVRLLLKEPGRRVLYCSDQGLPNVEDPGATLLEMAVAQRMIVQVLPGPSALTVALAACPFVLRRGFIFEGFLPQKRELREPLWQKIAVRRDRPTVLFETPYRLKTIAVECCENLKPHQRIVVALDISGPSELFLHSTGQHLPKDLEAAGRLHLKLPSVLIIDC